MSRPAPENPSARPLHRPPHWLETAVFYQIYPQSFCDTNGDGIGDLPGIVSRLDYVQSLGITALWLSPIFESPFGDAGYDVSDFYRVAPRYGTMDDFRELVREVRRRGMKLCLDLVAGHTSSEHPWFQESAKAQRNRYSDWYIWTDTVWGPPEPNAIRGYSARFGGYLPNFFYFQPALNYGYAHPDPAKPWQLPVTHPAVEEVRAELRRIMKFWLDAGVDGFRVDMASSLVRIDPDGTGIRDLWRSYREWLDEEYPEAVLIAEWSNPRRAIEAGFDIDFLIHFGEHAYNALLGTPWGENPESRELHGGPAFFDRQGRGDIRRFLDNYLKHYTVTAGQGYISLPTGNHDFPRHRRTREEEELRVVLAMLLTLPGVPFIYYGDEIGMRYLENLDSKEGSYENRTGTRTPMQWARGRNAGFSTAEPSWLYLPVDLSENAPNVEAQEADPGSLLHLTRRLLACRVKFPALGNTGKFRPVYAEKGRYPFVYERSCGDEVIWVAVNPTENALSLTLLGVARSEAIEVAGADLQANGGSSELSMGPVSYGIFRVWV